MREGAQIVGAFEGVGRAVRVVVHLDASERHAQPIAREAATDGRVAGDLIRVRGFGIVQQGQLADRRSRLGDDGDRQLAPIARQVVIDRPSPRAERGRPEGQLRGHELKRAIGLHADRLVGDPIAVGIEIDHHQLGFALGLDRAFGGDFPGDFVGIRRAGVVGKLEIFDFGRGHGHERERETGPGPVGRADRIGRFARADFGGDGAEGP